MKFTTIPAAIVAAILLSAPSVAGKAHRHSRRIEHPLHHPLDASFLEKPFEKRVQKRGGDCPFPTDDSNLVAVTPDEKNAGWAMSPDQECTPGSYCPFACKPGMVMAQWEPDSTYDYPSSMNGGLYCNDDGEIEKPFKGKPNCVQGSGAIEAVNKCGSEMSWCQTVLPGNEAMIIPTLVGSSATLAVPDESYWCSTAAHYYINPPGVGEEGCIWGSEDEPVGNWSPYVAGANTDSKGQTFVKLGWNPIWEDSGLKSTLPEFGVEIKCPDGGCNGLPCKIDPSDGEGKVGSSLSAVGAGNAAFCVVTVSKGSTAQIIAFSVGSDSDSSSDYSIKSSSDDEEEEAESTTEEAESSTSVAETTSAEPTTTSEESTTTTTTTTTSEESTTSTTSTTSTEPTTTTASTTSTTSTTTSEEETTTTTPKPKTKTTATSTHFTKKKTKTTTEEEETTTKKARPTVNPGIFHENSTTTAKAHNTITDEPSATDAGSAAAPTTSKEGEAIRPQGSAAVASFVVAFIAAACFL
ncbi:hypothetical protein AK830_g7659 [Neonectria ditissima]|uniref:Secreted beta-glucosidase adg3 n=1 Tax=Neonectria ditissima TaxID=78410 RepID=A0A0P7AM58_9HYPO|nr:hypothetical protein AK830_g7659 [Neonectria ditissima]